MEAKAPEVKVQEVKTDTAPKATETQPAPRATDNQPAPKATETQSTPKATDNQPAPKAADNQPTPEKAKENKPIQFNIDNIIFNDLLVVFIWIFECESDSTIYSILESLKNRCAS